MSEILNIKIRNHIESQVRKHLYLHDCKPHEEAKALTRGLAAICLAGATGQTYEKAADHVIDGPDDNGIDGVIYDQTKNKLFIIQAKWSAKGTGTIEVGDLHKFIKGTKDLLSLRWKNFNERMKSISKNIEEILLKKDPSIVLIIAFNSESKISPHCTEIIEDFQNQNNADSQELVSVAIYNLNKINRIIRSINSGSQSDTEANLLQWGEQKEPYYSIYGKISCADIAEWHHEHGDLLFTDNIRNTLSDSDINSSIEAAIINAPHEFWYLNNGITAIADGIKRKPIGLGEQKDSSYWSISNLKIVNGAQTTGSIASAYNKDPKAVRNAYVQIKIISLDKAPADISKRITTATNTQNKVEPRDFLSLEPEQEAIFEAFKGLGIQYCYRRGEKPNDSGTSLDVQELAIALAVTSQSMADVVIAKRNAGSLTDPNGHYQKIFGQKISIEKAWVSVEKYRSCSKLLSRYTEKLDGKNAQVAIHGNRFIEHIVLTQDMPISEESIVNVHEKLLNAINKDYPDGYLAVLFKNANKCEDLKQEVTQQTKSSSSRRTLDLFSAHE